MQRLSIDTGTSAHGAYDPEQYEPLSFMDAVKSFQGGDDTPRLVPLLEVKQDEGGGEEPGLDDGAPQGNYCAFNLIFEEGHPGDMEHLCGVAELSRPSACHTRWALLKWRLDLQLMDMLLGKLEDIEEVGNIPLKGCELLRTQGLGVQFQQAHCSRRSQRLRKN